jgi:hypothetical protein
MVSAAIEFRVSVLISFQRALLQNVPANLRGVAVVPVGPIIRARFIFETVGDEEFDIAGTVATEVNADFLAPVEVWEEAIAVPPDDSRDLEPGEVWVDLRQEPLLEMD